VTKRDLLRIFRVVFFSNSFGGDIIDEENLSVFVVDFVDRIRNFLRFRCQFFSFFTLSDGFVSRYLCASRNFSRGNHGENRRHGYQSLTRRAPRSI